MKQKDYDYNIFINCPFDRTYARMFNAIVFTITHCGFYVRCALEEPDSSENRLLRILNIISECKYSIHDISRQEIDTSTQLPRFNMPLELGIFLGAKSFGKQYHKDKKCLILDKEPYRYRQSVSDIAGLDIEYHNGSIKKAIVCVRNWLANTSGSKRLYSGSFIYQHYLQFQKELPKICNQNNLDARGLTFLEHNSLANAWCIQTI
ncbi:hypothetical protein ACFLYN_03005 [Chloroflexota bacterium]